MKNAFRIMLAVVVISFTYPAPAQKTKPFQGIVTYNITYTGASLTPATKAQLPTVSTVSIKECKTKTEVVTGPVTQSTITDGTTRTETLLIDLMGTKYAVKLTSQEITDGLAKTPMPAVTITEETKVIAGFTCKKAILKTIAEDGSVSNDTVYFTSEIGCADLNFSTQFKDIPGAVLEYTEYTPQIDATAYFKTKEIKKSKVSDNIFLIPSDYKEVTKEELKKTFGGE